MPISAWQTGGEWRLIFPRQIFRLIVFFVCSSTCSPEEKQSLRGVITSDEYKRLGNEIKVCCLPPSLNISPAQLRPKRRFETKQ